MAGGPAMAGDGFEVVNKNKIFAILLVTFASFGGMLFGFDIGNIGGILAMPYWLQSFGNKQDDGTFAISTGRKSLIVSILSVGTFFGALFAYPMGDFIGRKMGIIVSTLVFCFGVALQTASTSQPLFIAGRVFAGAGVGLVSCLVPMYQSECSPKWIRGTVVACYQLAITIGILLANIVDNATKDRKDASSYRIPVATQFAFAGVLMFGMLFLPESPRFLINKGRDDAARASLARLLMADAHSAEVDQEVADIEANLEAERALGQTSYIDCFSNGKGKNRLRTLTGIALQAWQQLTGINFIFYYGTTFFKNAGFKNPFIISIITGVVNTGSTFPALWAIDHVGRRRLLLVGAICMCICEYIVAIIGVSTEISNLAAQKAMVALVCIYIFFFASTWGPIAWVMTGEIFPLAIRAKAMSMSVASNWFWNWLLAYVTPYLVDPGKGNANLGAKVFFIWGTTCFGCFIFTYFFIPETMGLSLEQIDILYQNSTPMASERYRKELLALDVHAADLGAVDKVNNVVDHDHHHDAEKGSHVHHEEKPVSTVEA